MIIAIASRGEPVVVSTNIENLPDEISGFKGIEDYFAQAVYDELNADKHLYRHYRLADGRQVDLYIGYYGTAKGGRSAHNPYACIPSSGWGILERREVRITSKHHPDGTTVNYILSQKGTSYDVVYHWYQSDRSKILASGIQQNLQRLVGRVLHNRNDGAFVRVSAITDENGIERTENLVAKFSSDILDILPDYWPVEERGPIVTRDAFETAPDMP